MSFSSVDCVPLTRIAEPVSDGDFVRYNILIAKQNLSGESALLFKGLDYIYS